MDPHAHPQNLAYPQPGRVSPTYRLWICKVLGMGMGMRKCHSSGPKCFFVTKCHGSVPTCYGSIHKCCGFFLKCYGSFLKCYSSAPKCYLFIDVVIMLITFSFLFILLFILLIMFVSCFGGHGAKTQQQQQQQLGKIVETSWKTVENR